MKGKRKISTACMMFLICIILIAPLAESQQPFNITESAISDEARSFNESSQVISYSGVSESNLVTNISRDDAYGRVLANVLDGNTSGRWIYSNTLPVAPGTTIATWYGDIVMPNSEGWLFFIDDMPFQSWAHQCRFVHVDANDGATTVMDAYGPPKDLNTWEMKASNVSIPQPAKLSILPMQGLTLNLPPCTDKSKCYAVLISGGINPASNWERYYSDIQFMYTTLRSIYGYPKANIYVLMSDGVNPGADKHLYNGSYVSSDPDLDGDGSKDYWYSATKANITTVFNLLKTNMASGGHLFIFTTDHGGPESTPQVGTNVIMSLWGEEIKDDEFNSELAKIPTTDPIYITMEQCYSGGFVDDVIPSVPLPSGQVRVIATAANAYESSYGDTFSKLWISAVRGFNVSGAPVDADTDNNGVVTLQEAFTYAKDNDDQPEHPQYLATPSGIGSKRSLISCCPSSFRMDKIGLFRPSTARWYLDYDNNGASNYQVTWGASTDKPVAGDWDGDRVDEIGLFRPSTARWYLDYDNNGASNYQVTWGASTDIPVAGDWDDDGKDEIGLFRPSTRMWYLDYDNNGQSDFRVTWGDSTDIPVAGDWDGDGKDEIGLFRPSTARWYLDYDNNGASNYQVTWGASTDIPVAGDWDGDGKDEIGLFRPSTRMWYLDYDNNGQSDFRVTWGDSTDKPVVGRWTECMPGVCGSYTGCDDSCGPLGGICFKTTEGTGICLENWYCSEPYTSCTSSSQCGSGYCVTGSCCGRTECRPASTVCGVNKAPSSAEQPTGPTASGE